MNDVMKFVTRNNKIDPNKLKRRNSLTFQRQLDFRNRAMSFGSAGHMNHIERESSNLTGISV
jgi:hypothetical protein